MTARDVMRWLEEREPEAGPEEGFKLGDRDADVAGVFVCWMPTAAALEQAIAERCNLVICHETLFYPLARPIDAERCWHTNRVRMALMHRGEMVVYRAHGMLDRLCIFDEFAAALGLSEVHSGEAFARVFSLPPTRLGELVARAKQVTAMPAVRVTGDLERQVTRVGLPWGGLGLVTNIGFMQQLVENGAEAGICGETDEHAMRFAEDAGMALIETSHAVCENLGLRRFADMLSEAHPGLKVVFHDTGPGWRIV